MVVATAVLAYGGIRLLRPDLTPGEGPFEGTLGDLERFFLHGDFGDGCFQIGCPPMASFFERFWMADVFLMIGSVVIGVALGLIGAIWCAMRPRTLASRVLEGFAMLAFCTPVYVVGLGLLLLFAPPFGVWQEPVFFSLHAYVAPWEDPVVFLRALTVPVLVCAAPIAAVVLRLALSAMVDVEHEEYMRTAYAKGLSHRRAVGRHAAPAAFLPVSGYLGVAVPWVVTNMVLVEIVFNVPGVFRFMRRAVTGPEPPGPNPDYPALQAMAVYAAVFIVVATILADLLLNLADPRIRRGRA